MRSLPPAKPVQPSVTSRELAAESTGVHLHSNLAWGREAREEGLDLREIWRKLWRGRRLVSLLTVVGTLFGIVAVEQLEPTYTATSTLMLETRQLQVFDAKAVLPGLVLDSDVIQGEVELLYSRELAKRVASQLGLAADPAFNGDLVEADSSWLADARSWLSIAVNSVREALGQGASAEDPLTPDDAANQLDREIVDQLLGALDVRQAAEAPIIRVSYTSGNPRVAATIANSVADLYIEGQRELKSSETRDARVWLQERITALRTEVEDKEREIEELRAETGILSSNEDDASIAAQQMSELSSQRITAILERQRAESQLERNAESEVLASPVIQGLRLKEEELTRELGTNAVEYGPKHPIIMNLQESLRGIQAGIAAERGRILAKLQSEVESARQREAQLNLSLEQLAKDVEATNNRLVEIRGLERDVAAKRSLLENFLVRMQETAQQEDIQQPDARIISFAEVPETPSFPNKKLFVLLAFCGSGFVGVALTYLLQSVDTSFQTVAQIREDLEMPVLQVFPMVRGWFGHVNPVAFVLDKPKSAFGEALRNLHVTLFTVRHPPKVVLFTSSLPNEGKTSLTLAFGRFLATTGRPVVAIDCDLRKPSAHRVLEGNRQPGLADHLLGNVSLEETIQTDQESGLHFVAAGLATDNPTDLLGSPIMHAAIAKLSRMYSIVLLDTAPVLAVADTRVLQPFADKTVLVVRWRSTPRRAASEAVRILEKTEYSFSIAGVVLNCVDVKSYRHYDEGYYHHSVRKYYNE